uniref:Uncharacterized protein n=1 Tax=Anguilla anguilla TaxID=7936 RepID=A0A0E9PG74_ANGAN
MNGDCTANITSLIAKMISYVYFLLPHPLCMTDSFSAHLEFSYFKDGMNNADSVSNKPVCMKHAEAFILMLSTSQKASHSNILL